MSFSKNLIILYRYQTTIYKWTLGALFLILKKSKIAHMFMHMKLYTLQKRNPKTIQSSLFIAYIYFYY